MNCNNCPFDEDLDVSPFSNGTDAMVWHGNNCDHCLNYEAESTEVEQAKCEMAFYIDIGFLSSEIPLRIAKLIGCKYDPLYHSATLFKKCLSFKDTEIPF